jgi:hypothetical protein
MVEVSIFKVESASAAKAVFNAEENPTSTITAKSSTSRF